MAEHVDVPAALADLRATAARLGRPVRLMEVCGTHTVSFFRSGIKSLLPPSVRLISGPGCPVCVTSQGYLDAACAAAARPDVIVCTYGDMVRVPGRTDSLERRRAEGARIQVVYSARDALALAERTPDKQVVFLAVGFETTAPATAATVLEAEARGVRNFTVLPGHKLVVPALEALLSAGEVPLDGFLLPGHVSIVIGVKAYRPVVARFRKPSVVVGFEPRQLALGVARLLRLLERGEPVVENVYGVAVTEEGNRSALDYVERVFEPASAVWRAMGTLPASGLELRPAYRSYSALERLGLVIGPDEEAPGCRCGEVIQGKLEPAECALFGSRCTPTAPVGPCMVSSEGTCSAWFKYGRAAAAAAPSSLAVPPAHPRRRPKRP